MIPSHLCESHQQETGVEVAVWIATQCTKSFGLLFDRRFEYDTKPLVAQFRFVVQLPDILNKMQKNLFSKKVLLADINLSVHSGEMVLLLGGSGAGKTTFFNAVMGYEPANGQIRYDGIDVYKEYNKMKYAIGYVQQEDLLRKTDVVLNTLRDAARMHLTEDKNEQERAVMETLKLLGLEKEQKKLVGQLSGGQRKRLSIGVEY